MRRTSQSVPTRINVARQVLIIARSSILQLCSSRYVLTGRPNLLCVLKSQRLPVHAGGSRIRVGDGHDHDVVGQNLGPGLTRLKPHGFRRDVGASGELDDAGFDPFCTSFGGQVGDRLVDSQNRSRR